MPRTDLDTEALIALVDTKAQQLYAMSTELQAIVEELRRGRLGRESEEHDDDN